MPITIPAVTPHRWAASLARGAAHQPSLAGRLRHLVPVVGDLVILVGIVLCFPFTILAIGIPIALVLQLLLWFGRLLF